MAVDGGDSYWHKRRSGIDTGRMVTDDLLPLMEARSLTTKRIGLIGWSMGGYGALLIASRLGPNRVAAAVATSAALWQSPGDSAPGAFDDAKDFARNDVFAAKAKPSGTPIRLDCGTQDPFLVANQALAHSLPQATATFTPGAHDAPHWQSQLAPPR